MNNRMWKKHMDDVFGILSRFALAGLLGAILVLPANAGDREQARRIYDRIAGVPPTADEMLALESAMAGTNTDCGGYPLNGIVDIAAECAAYLAMENKNFYNVTLKNFAAPWTNRDRSVFVPLNDYIATVIGMIRENVPFNLLLSEDITYTGRPNVVPTPPAANSNRHYEELEENNVNLKLDLVRGLQSDVNNIPGDKTAGVLTSRAASEAFFVAGTNRAMFRFTMVNHFCSDMEQLHDPALPPDRIRQDVSRSPGGDSRLFLNNCIGCHTGMDPMAQAFAYYDYDDDVNDGDPASMSLEFTDGVVQSKYFNNDLNFPPGYRTPNDHWDNYWRSGQNSYLFTNSAGVASPGPTSGDGAKSLGVELGNSEAFASCQVKKVFQAVCLREPDLGDPLSGDAAAFSTIVSNFKNGYLMKQVFADTAVHCMGQ
jgi:hypothetical protein